MAHTFISFEGVELNATHYSKMTAEEFAASLEPHLWANYSEKDRKAIIKKAFGLIKSAVKKASGE